mgnify:CR=1 FL=1
MCIAAAPRGGEGRAWLNDPDLWAMETLLTGSAVASMPGHARLWIYKSATPFTQEQLAIIRSKGLAFTEAWSSHGDQVVSALDVLEGHFVVLAADLEHMKICGGAVDGSVQFIKSLERDLGLNLTDRMVVLYEQEGAVHSCRVNDLEGMIKEGTLTGDTAVYDDLVATKSDLDSRFRTRLRDTWMARYL